MRGARSWRCGRSRQPSTRRFIAGPTARVYTKAGDIVLGHRRLSIIDLSDAGLQPMANEDGSLQVTFNGEIYNYRELRHQLTACGHSFRLAVRYGSPAARLRAVGDGRSCRTPARDVCLRASGCRPGSFARPGPSWHQAALLLRSNRRERFEVFWCCLGSQGSYRERRGPFQPRSPGANRLYLMAGAVPQPLTIEKAVMSPAGYWAEWIGGSLRLHRYWDFGADGASDSSSPAALQASLAPLVEDTWSAGI